jgi:enoyl-CoA hydratase/carnithine racemase
MSGRRETGAACSGRGGQPTVLWREEEGIGTLTISHPPANAIDSATVEALRKRLEALAEGSDEVRGIILTGSGSRFFSAGGDVKELDGMTKADGMGRVSGFHSVLGMLERLEIPVACAVNGDAVGGGSELCLFADYRVAVSSARFGFPEINHGMLPAARSIQQAVRLLGMREARRLLLEGRLIDAEEAARIGLIDAVAQDGNELRRETFRWASGMAEKPRALLGPLKRTIALTGRLSDGEILQMTMDDFTRYFGDAEVRGLLRGLIDRWRRNGGRRERRTVGRDG